MSPLPSISVITNSYNPDLSIFRLSLESLRVQHYPQKLIEHIVMDAGSTNGAQELCNKYGCKVYVRPDLLNASQERMSIAIKQARNDLVFIFETDNILIGQNNLKMLVEPIRKHKEIWCTFSYRNGYFKGMPALTRYFALLGTNDSYLYYLDKVEKMPHDVVGYNRGTVLEEYPNYYTVNFPIEHFPPMGDNGFMVKKEIIDIENHDPKNFLHVDVFYNLALKGYSMFGAVKNEIIHYSGSDIWKQYKSRVYFKNTFYDKRRGERTYLTFNPNSLKDVLNTIKFVLFSFTFIVPVVRSVKGYLLIQDSAWFLHPLVCFIAAMLYTKSEFSYILKTYFSNKHGPYNKA